MSTSTINLPLYQTLVGLNVPKDEAGRAADISDLVRKDEILRLATKTDMDAGFRAAKADVDAGFAKVAATIDGVRLQIETASHAQTKWLMATILTTAGLSIATLMSLLHLFPPH
jgi:hypothetical protein